MITIGTEATFIPRNWNDKTCWSEDQKTGHGYRLLNNAFYKLYPRYNAYIDQHCLEIASPVFKNPAKLIRWYDKLRKFAFKRGLTPHNKTTVCGGGHIHIGGLTPKQMHKCVVYTLNNPYIAWTFLQPADTDSANIPQQKDLEFETDTFSSLLQTFRIHPYKTRNILAYLRIQGWQTNYRNTKLFAADTTDTPTLQYRCVEAPKNIQEFANQLTFFLRFTSWALNQPDDFFRLPVSFDDWTYERALTAFKELCESMSLDWQVYRRQINQNLKPRFLYDCYELT